MRTGLSLLLRGVAAVSIGVAASAVAVSPAFAGNFDGTCNDNEVCLYSGDNYTGSRADFTVDVSNYVSYNFYGTATNLNDQVSSLWNTANFFDVTIYENSNYDGAELTTGTNSGRATLGVLNNQASSHFF